MNDPLPEAADPELSDWKDALRYDFETWLASLDQVPADEEVEGEETGEAPDLYSFYEQLAAAGAESRKANRRTAEAISQWGDVLARFDGALAPLQETVAALIAVQPKESGLSRAHCLVLVELLDRMHRLGRVFQSPPTAKRAWWGANDETWRKAWQAQAQALAILISHLEAFLRKEGVTRIETVGQPFDPALMMAVAAEPDATRPAQTVLEEMAAGFLLKGELLRSAQVKVSRRP